ncbi:MAG: 2Fe-2S iron-sulfur cluster-binding protein [Cyanobacteria bacterium P01_D01_bin.116]
MTTTYNVEFIHQGKTHALQVPEDKTILSVAEKAGLELPCSCNAGVCTTCAGKIINGGSVDQSEGMGVSPDLQNQGFALLCVAYPRSDLKIETEQEDIVYQNQFGKV